MSFLERRWPLLLAFIFLIGLAFRLGYLYQVSGTPFFRPLTLDSEAYEAKAAEILSSPGFLPRGVFYQTPFYPYLLAFLHKMFGRTLLPIRLLQILLGAFLPVLAFLISRRYFPVSTSLLAALFSAFYGPLLYEDALGDKTTLAAFFFALAALASAKAAGNQKGWLLAGFSWGVAALVRENFLLVGVVLSLIYGRKKVWLALLGILLAVLPVTLMNLRAGDFALVTSQGGQNFYIGNNPQATGGYAASEGDSRVRAGGFQEGGRGEGGEDPQALRSVRLLAPGGSELYPIPSREGGPSLCQEGLAGGERLRDSG